MLQASVVTDVKVVVRRRSQFVVFLTILPFGGNLGHEESNVAWPHETADGTLYGVWTAVLR